MKARITVTLKSGILDPQGKAIEGALKSLGIAGVASVRQGKVFDIEIEGRDRKAAQAALEQAADKLLANSLIENYQVELKRSRCAPRSSRSWRKLRAGARCHELGGRRLSRHQSRTRHGARAPPR